MDVPIISGFEAGIRTLEDPSILSRMLDLSLAQEGLKIYSLCTWGAIILAFVATFGSVVKKLKLIVFGIHDNKSLSSQKVDMIDDIDVFSACSATSDHEDESLMACVPDTNRMSPREEDFRVMGREHHEETINGSWSVSPELTLGNPVVKFWDSSVSMWETNQEKIIRSFSIKNSQIPAISTVSPEVFISAGISNHQQAELKVWDLRACHQIPAAVTALQPLRRRISRIHTDGNDKLYVSDELGFLSVRDLRKIIFPLESWTGSVTGDGIVQRL